MPDDIRKRFWKSLSQSPFALIRLEGSSDHAEPMTAQLDADADGRFWFYTTQDNRIARGGPALMSFSSTGHDLFASVAGTLVEEKDPALIDRYWSDEVAAYYPGGRNDPSLLMLRFDLSDAEIWGHDRSMAKALTRLAGLSSSREQSVHEKTNF